jgi:hypothetical protein
VVIAIALFRSGVPNLKTDQFDELSKQIFRLGPFQPWVVGDKTCPYADCSVGSAPIYIYAKKNAADDTDLHGSLTYTSYFVSGSMIQRITSVSVPINADGTAAAPTDLEAKSLLGSLTFDDNFKLSINLPDSEQTLQLVPAPINATDPDFEPILEHILEGKGIPAQRSRFTANALHGPRDAITCPGTQRYLVYRVRLDQYPHKLQGRVFVEAYTEGFVLDCAAPSFVPAATGRFGKSYPQTSALLNDFAALLVALKPKIQTAAMTGGISSFSKLVDVETGTKDVQTTVASLSLQNMVNHLCDRLDGKLDPSPSPNGSPSPTPTPTPSPTPTPGGKNAQPMLVREPLRCNPLPSRRQGASPSTAAPKAAVSPKSVVDGWFDARMGVKPAPQRTPTPR